MTTPTSDIDDTKPTHASPQTTDIRLQFTTAKGEINELFLHSPSVIDGRDFGFLEDDDASQDNGNWQLMYDQAPNYARLTLPRGKQLITVGAGGTGVSGSNLVRKPLTLDGTGSRIYWQPATSNDWLLTVSGMNVSFSDALNEELQVFGFRLINVRVIGNRVSRANAFRFIRCDYVTTDSLHVYAVKGTSLKLQKTRECEIKGLRTRFNAYLDFVNFHNSSADVILCNDTDGGTITGDNTNFCHFGDTSLTYSLGPLLQADGVGTISFDQCMLHALQLGNQGIAYGGGTGSSNEDTFVRAMQSVGVTVSGGFTAGVANNEYAGLHVSGPVGNETVASATNLVWKPAMRKSRPITETGGSTLNFNRLTINGGFPDACVHMSNSTLSLASSTISGAEPSTTYHTSQAFTADATTDLITMGAATPYLLSLDAVRFTNSGGALPAPLVAYGTPTTLANVVNNTYYVRCTNAPTNTIYSLHATWNDARLNTNIINITGAGTGTHTLLHQHSEVAQLNNGSSLVVDNKTFIDNARWLVNDDHTSRVVGNYLSGAQVSSTDIARQLGGMVCLGALKGANMQLTTDQQFKSVYGTGLVYITRVLAVCVSGVSTGTVGGFYAAASKGGGATIAVATTTYWSKLTGLGKTLELTWGNNFGIAPTAVSQATDRSTLVTCSALRGTITTQATSLAAGADATFTVTNTLVSVGDNVHVNRTSGSTANTSDFRAINITNGSFQIWAHNHSAATADTAAAVLNFRVDKTAPIEGLLTTMSVPPFLSLTTGSSTACIVDFYIFGIPANHP